MSKFRMSNQNVLRKFVIPQMVAMLFNSIYLIVDGIFIGHRLGPDALAAGGIAVPVVEIVIALAMMISVGAGVMLSKSFAEDNVLEANQIFNQANVLTGVLSLAISILGFIYVTDISIMLGASSNILADTVTYLRYFFLGLPFLMFSFTLSTFVRNDASPKRAMWALVVGAISNILLDYIFMYPLNLGMAGAALATALGPVFGVMILIPHFIKKRGKLYFKLTWVRLNFLRDIFKTGLAAFVTNFSIGMIALFYNLAIVYFGYGDMGLSAYLIIGYISLIALRCFMGAAQGIQPVLSVYQNQKDYDQIGSLNRFMVYVVGVFGLLLTVIIFVFRKQLVMIFTSDAGLIAMSSHITQIYFVNLVFAAINILIATNLQALNQQRMALILSLLRTTLPLVIFLVLLPNLFPVNGIWWAMSATEVFTLVFSVLAWKNYRKRAFIES